MYPLFIFCIRNKVSLTVWGFRIIYSILSVEIKRMSKLRLKLLDIIIKYVIIILAKFLIIVLIFEEKPDEISNNLYLLHCHHFSVWSLVHSLWRQQWLLGLCEQCLERSSFQPLQHIWTTVGSLNHTIRMSLDSRVFHFRDQYDLGWFDGSKKRIQEQEADGTFLTCPPRP